MRIKTSISLALSKRLKLADHVQNNFIIIEFKSDR